MVSFAVCRQTFSVQSNTIFLRFRFYLQISDWWFIACRILFRICFPPGAFWCFERNFSSFYRSSELFFFLIHRKVLQWNIHSYLGSSQASWPSVLSPPHALYRASVQSPTIRTWILKWSSSGAEVRVKGCHSSCEMDGHFMKTYWPTSILKPFFFNWSSRVFDGCITTWWARNKG